MKKIVFLLCLMLAVLFPLAGIDQVKLAIGYIPHIQFSPLYVGIDKGFYKETGIELSIEYGFGLDIFSLLATERIDLGLSDSDQLIIAGTKNLDLKAVFQYYQDYPVSIVAKEDIIKIPSDFEGKKIGSPSLSGTSYIGLKLFLDRYGLTDSVTIEQIGYTQIPSLLSDKIEGVVCFYNNEPVQIRLMDTKIRSWNVKDFSNMVGASFISSDSIIKNRKDVLARFIEATKKAIAYTTRNQDEAVEISLKYIGNVQKDKIPFIKEVLRVTCGLFESSEEYGYLDKGRYEESIEVLRKLKLIDRTIPAETILYGF